jgi:uncharacterized membrane protein
MTCVVQLSRETMSNKKPETPTPRPTWRRMNRMHTDDAIVLLAAWISICTTQVSFVEVLPLFIVPLLVLILPVERYRTCTV